MANTKDFPATGSAPVSKRKTKKRFSQPNNAGKGPVASPPRAPSNSTPPPADLNPALNVPTSRITGTFNPQSDPRSTLIMKPGESAAAIGNQGAARPKKNYGLPSGADLHTVVMGATDASSAIAQTIQSGGQGNSGQSSAAHAAPSHPVAQNQKPPEIELVKHAMPKDAPPDSRLVLLNDPDSKQAAAFRVLRHHVLECGHPQVIAVSGPAKGCGKTTVAINLAMALAECGRADVLLIDANLRNPQLASILRFVPPWCFSQQLEQHRDQPFLPWGLVEIPDIDLHVAAINPRTETKSRLDAPAFAIAIDRLRLGPYQHIVIDCPSVLGNADVNLIQDATDGVLLAARSKQVTTRDIRDAVDQLTPTKILGTALFDA